MKFLRDFVTLVVVLVLIMLGLIWLQDEVFMCLLSALFVKCLLDTWFRTRGATTDEN